MDRALPVKNAVSTVRTTKNFGVPVVHSTINVAADREQPTLPDLAGRLSTGPPPGQQEVLAIAEKWRPCRSLATSYLFPAASEPASGDGVRQLGSA
jgi:hypothetical protein